MIACAALGLYQHHQGQDQAKFELAAMKQNQVGATADENVSLATPDPFLQYGLNQGEDLTTLSASAEDGGAAGTNGTEDNEPHFV